jgi:hypothetical protein
MALVGAGLAQLLARVVRRQPLAAAGLAQVAEG